MAINLSGKVSDEDKSRVNDKRNPPDIDVGDAGGGLDELFKFDDLGEDSFGGGDSGGGGGSDGLADFGNLFGGSSDTATLNPFDNPSPGGLSTTFGGGFTTPAIAGQAGTQQPQEAPKDNVDKILEYSGDAVNSLGHILLELVKSVKNRTNDDFAQLSTTLIKVGAVVAGVGAISTIIGTLAHIPLLGFWGLGKTLFLSGALSSGTGLCGMGFSAIMLVRSLDDSSAGVDTLPDVSTQIEDDSTSDYEEGLGDMLDDLMSKGFDFEDDVGEDNPFGGSDILGDEPAPEPVIPSFNPNIKPDFGAKLEEIPENRLLTRQVLVETMVNFLPFNTPEFSTKREIPEGSDEFNTLETICLKAISNVMKCEVEEVKSGLHSAYETYFSYELKMKRVRGLNKTAELERELEIYLRDNAGDTSVNATVDIEQDFYKAIVTKGVTAVVTMGDAFKQDYVRDYYLNEKNKLPIMVGVSELGKIVLDDAKNSMTMLVAGKPRSGKSWALSSILTSMMFFNSPEDVQFVIVDPKKSTLFTTMSLMPHVAGLHDEDNILEIMDDIINNEAPRRKDILLNHKCDDIWAVRKKGIRLPVLYLVIDEYMSVRAKLDSLAPELDSKLQTIISQFPSLGIGVIFVPHRATGVVSRTIRTMIAFASAVRANIEDVKDTLGIKSWDRSLTNPGDIAVKTTSSEDAFYVRGLALATSDEDNVDLILNVAKAFYKMGVDLPDMSTMTIAYNRDEDYIREELEGEGNRIQYNASNILADLD